MTLWRWSLLEAPRTTRRFSEDHIDFHSSSQWFSWAGNQASPSWSFQLLFFFNTAQVSSAFSLSSVEQQDPLIRNLMAKAPIEGSQEVQKDGTLIWQPLRTGLGAHKQLEDFLLEIESSFQLTWVLAKKNESNLLHLPSSRTKLSTLSETIYHGSLSSRKP